MSTSTDRCSYNETKAFVREIRLFEWYVSHIWPIQRRFVRKHLTPRCRQCFLPETYRPLRDGVCPDCLDESHVAEATNVSVEQEQRMQAEFDQLALMTTDWYRPSTLSSTAYSIARNTEAKLATSCPTVKGSRVAPPATPASPMLLLVTAAAIPATCVPCQ